jgi:CheY-like chemotaxis protein
MTAEVKERIFEPFFTTRPPGKGAGLGLALVYGIVKSNSGHLEVDSELGVGTTFRLYWPRTQEPVPQGEPLGALASAPGGTETVLLIERDEAMLVMTRHVLQRCGYSVLSATDAGEARRMAERQEGPIHLLVVDLFLKEIDGPQLVEQLSALRPGVKVLYLAGYVPEAGLSRRMLVQGAVLDKPFSTMAFARKVREVLDK